MISVSSSHFEQLTHLSTQIIKNPTRFVLSPFVNSDHMDFHSLTRRELQSLCKLNKIPANITNVAMADKLQSLEIVEGIEKFFKVSQSETADLVESTRTVDVSSPKVTNTRCRTTTRQKVKITEAENLPATSTRTSRRGSKQVAKGHEELNNDMLQTPALSSSKRKILAASSCQNLNSQLNDFEEERFGDLQSECKPSSPEKAVTINRRKGAATSITMKKESNVQKKTYNSRRSTRLTEKKSGEPRVKKESEKAVKINSLLDEVNVTSEEVLPVEVLETTFAGNPDELVNLKPNLDEITNPHEDGDLEEKLKIGEKFDHGEEDSSEVIDINQESDKISNPSCENVDLEEENLCLGHKFDVSEAMVPEKHSDMVIDDNADIKSELEEEGMFTSTTDINEGSENMVDEPLDVIPTIDVVLTTTVEVEDLKLEVLSEKNDADCSICSSVEEYNQISEYPSTLVDLIDHPTGVTPMKTSVSKKDMQKTPALSSIRRTAPATPSSHNVNSGLNDCQEEFQMPDSAVTNGWRSSATMEKESGVESEQVVEINSFLDDVKVTSGNPDSNMECDTFGKHDVVAEEKEDSGEVENLNPESDEDLEGKPEAGKSENVDLEEEELEFREKLNASEVMISEDSDGNLSVEGNEKNDADSGENFKNPSTGVTPMKALIEKSECGSAVTNSQRSSTTMKKEWKELEQVVEINLLSEVASDGEVSEKSTDAKLADICNTFEKLYVAVEEKEDSDEVQNLKYEIKNPNENGCLIEDEKTKEASDDMNSNNPQELGDENMFCADLETNNDAEKLSGERELGEEEGMFCGDSEKFEIATYFEEEKELARVEPNSSMGKIVDEEKKKKKISSVVSDDKENMKKKDETRRLKEISIRQLRKQIKALTLKTINNNEDTTNLKEGTGRAALQALCENQMVGGLETKK